MVQAVLEQFITFKRQDDKILAEAFRWGFDPDTLAEEGTDDWMVNAMFLDEEEEFPSWKAIKSEHMQAVRFFPNFRSV